MRANVEEVRQDSAMPKPGISVRVVVHGRSLESQAAVVAGALEREGYAVHVDADERAPAGCIPILGALVALVGGAGAHILLRLTERVGDKALDEIAEKASSAVGERVSGRRARSDTVVIYGPNGAVLKEVRV